MPDPARCGIGKLTYTQGGSAVEKVDRAIWRLVDLAIFIAVLGMVVFIIIQVGSRLAGRSVPWTEELSRFLFFWTTYLGMAAGFRQGHHPSFGLLGAVLPRAAQRALTMVTPLAAAVFFGIVAYYGYGLLRQQITFGEMSPSLRIGMWVTTLPLVLGALLAIFGAAMHAFRDHPAFSFVPDLEDQA